MNERNGQRPAVDARSLSFSVDAAKLLDRVDVSAEPGQFVGLIGPNGAGKSTLLRAISNVLNYQEGSVSLHGADLKSLPAREVAELLALVPQIAPYTQGFTAFELVLMGRYPHLGRFQVEGQADDRIARNAMRLTETDQFETRTIETLSGGERQRVFLARAVAQQPQVLLLDEPTSNLDILHQLKILTLVRQLVDDGLTAIAAIHDLNLAARFCDRLVLISGGRVVADGQAEDVLTPEMIESAFGVESAIYREPVTGALAISLIAPAGDALAEPDLAGEAVPVPGGQSTSIRCSEATSAAR
ncbi:MAG: ABC transporter ATP-binding protein [Chloroflexi bacterium]|nr:ABC transporter ATP-binding protein [Chloroflexota bacterium]MCY3587928.1 ABC transporter ATP-binding protein [Chloroflexota bacterium]MCY3685991.1 ABC transporter ATP-binding protein [Chloroflexota bacterium]MDE2707291.1 ABC transporter ATP-binding protein [Chloroflexota bacterium]